MNNDILGKSLFLHAISYGVGIAVYSTVMMQTSNIVLAFMLGGALAGTLINTLKIHL